MTLNLNFIEKAQSALKAKLKTANECNASGMGLSRWVGLGWMLTNGLERAEESHFVHQENFFLC